MKTKILAECPACQATGLYRGFAEKDGESVVCLDCNGSGAKEISYVPFTGRKEIPGIKKVRISRGKFLIGGVGGINETAMSYEDFKSKFKSAQDRFGRSESAI